MLDQTPQGQSCEHRPLGVIFVQNGDAKHSQNVIACDIRDRPVIRSNGLLDHIVQKTHKVMQPIEPDRVMIPSRMNQGNMKYRDQPAVPHDNLVRHIQTVRYRFRCPGFDRVNRRNKPISSTRHGLDIHGRFSCLSQDLSQLPDAHLEHRITDDGLRPYLLQQRLFQHQFPGVRDEMYQDIKGFGSHG